MYCCCRCCCCCCWVREARRERGDGRQGICRVKEARRARTPRIPSYSPTASSTLSTAASEKSLYSIPSRMRMRVSCGMWHTALFHGMAKRPQKTVVVRPPVYIATERSTRGSFRQTLCQALQTHEAVAKVLGPMLPLRMCETRSMSVATAAMATVEPSSMRCGTCCDR